MIEIRPTNIARWQDYVLERGRGVTEFWKEHLTTASRDVLFVLAQGFDPRMCLGLEAVLDAGGTGQRQVMVIDLEDGFSSSTNTFRSLAGANQRQLNRLLQGRATCSRYSVQIWSADGRRVKARNAAKVFSQFSDIAQYSDIVIDISAMSRSVFIPLVAKLLYLLESTLQDTEVDRPNLHVLVAENPILDLSIRSRDLDDSADYIHPFSGIEMEATAERPKIWIPLLGETQETQLERVYDLVIPDEISPLLPSPSFNPRRGDDLILEYRALLFDRLRIEPQNFIYASEWNPFEVYRQIRKTVLHYRDALQPVGGCKTILSLHSSKLMSIGALLVAYELRQAGIEIGIGHLEADSYTIMHDIEPASWQGRNELFQLWLSGECYNVS